MQPDVTVIDYGAGNLYSVKHALEHVGANVQISSDATAVRQATRLILPGVGAFASGMARLRETGLDEAIIDAASKGTPVLGICLGMQMLFDVSEEFGTTSGLSLIPGTVLAIPNVQKNGKAIKVPHIGWSDLKVSSSHSNWNNTPLQETPDRTAVYFVHSFMACPDNTEHTIAVCNYGDTAITAMVGSGSIWGAQFHPERSGQAGLGILKQFMQTALPHQNSTLRHAA